MDYKDVKKLRATFPAILTVEQQEEFLNLLDSDDRDKNLALGFNTHCDCHDSELDLFWRYEARCAAFDARKNKERYGRSMKNQAVAELCGMILYSLVYHAFEASYGVKKESRALAIFEAWKKETDKEIFDIQMKGFEEMMKMSSITIKYDTWYKFASNLKNAA